MSLEPVSNTLLISRKDERHWISGKGQAYTVRATTWQTNKLDLKLRTRATSHNPRSIVQRVVSLFFELNFIRQDQTALKSIFKMSQIWLLLHNFKCSKYLVVKFFAGEDRTNVHGREMPSSWYSEPEAVEKSNITILKPSLIAWLLIALINHKEKKDSFFLDQKFQKIINCEHVTFQRGVSLFYTPGPNGTKIDH